MSGVRGRHTRTIVGDVARTTVNREQKTSGGKTRTQGRQGGECQQQVEQSKNEAGYLGCPPPPPPLWPPLPPRPPPRWEDH